MTSSLVARVSEKVEVLDGEGADDSAVADGRRGGTLCFPEDAAGFVSRL
jgi:hypothetical protein